LKKKEKNSGLDPGGGEKMRGSGLLVMGEKK